MRVHLGEQLGHYRLVKFLTAGGSTEIYVAEHVYLNTQFAVKVIYASQPQQVIESFHREVQIVKDIMVRLDHPNLIRYYDYGSLPSGDIHYIAMQYTPFGSLRNRHRGGERVPLPTVKNYIMQIAGALQFVHTYDLVHRDIKPENILLLKQDQVVVSDFGIAAITQRAESFRSQEAVGTLYYAAPEQFSGKYYPASDQYALGVTVYEWLTGRIPFGANTSVELVNRHRTETPLPLRRYLPDISPQTEAVVQRALAKNPKDRYSTIQEFAYAFARGESRLSFEKK